MFKIDNKDTWKIHSSDPPPPPLFLKGGSKFWLPSPEGGSEKLKKGVVV